MRIQSVLSGVISTLPGGNEWLFRRHEKRKPRAGTSSARYCYSIWLRHLVLANKYCSSFNGLPRSVAELGPGSSFGTGLAALLSGVNKYYAFDVVPHTKDERNMEVFDELLALFKRKEAIPTSKEFPEIFTELDDYRFPAHILNDDILGAALSPARTTNIRRELSGTNKLAPENAFIVSVVPWHDVNIISEGIVEMVVSMSVMEHVDDLELAYRAFGSWLKKGGVMSHEIDFRSHGHSDVWNGHWSYSDFVWWIIRGKRPYLLNRAPHSTHIDLIKAHGFDIVADIPKQDHTGLRRDDLAKRFKSLSDADICTKNAYVLATKK